MRRIILSSILFFGCILFLAAENSFRVELESAMGFNIPKNFESDRYDNILNPGNIQQIRDVSFENSIRIRLETAGDKAAGGVWFSLNQFPAGDAFLAAAGTDASAQVSVGDLVLFYGGYFYTIDIQRLYIDYYPGDKLRFTLGRQNFLTGYGYGWNPVDFVNPLKDPADPEAELKGVDALSVFYAPWPFLKFRFSVIAETSAGNNFDYGDIRFSGEITATVPYVEMKLTGLYDWDKTRGEDPYPLSLGFGFYADLAGVGIYGESAVRNYPRNYVPDDAYGLERPEKTVFSALLGAEYYFPSGLSAAAEYFCNGEGFNGTERRNYSDSLAYYGGSYIPADFSLLYRPGYFSRHYLLLNIVYPWYNMKTDFTVTAVTSLDAGSLMIIPRMDFNAAGNLTVYLYYTGLFSFDDSEKNEAWLSPVKHQITLGAKYYF